jgi:hypothetical protein
LKKELYYLPLFILLLNINPIHSQDISKTNDDNIFQYKGRVVDSENNPIAFAHVINLRRKNNTITDSSGYFRILVVVKDTLRITGIGFATKYIAVDRKPISDTLTNTIKLEKKVYDLPTVNVYELRWQIFKAEFMEQKVEEDKTSKRISSWMTNLVPSDELRLMFQGGRGVGFTIPYKSKAERSKRKVARLEKKYAAISPKFNDKLITSLTGLQGKEIYKFLQYCNFNEEFLIQSSEYEIIIAILRQWEEYNAKLPQQKE